MKVMLNSTETYRKNEQWQKWKKDTTKKKFYFTITSNGKNGKGTTNKKNQEKGTTKKKSEKGTTNKKNLFYRSIH